MINGSGEILKSSVRQGCSPKDRQMRCTLVGDIPTWQASSRLDQCVPPPAARRAPGHPMP